MTIAMIVFAVLVIGLCLIAMVSVIEQRVRAQLLAEAAGAATDRSADPEEPYELARTVWESFGGLPARLRILSASTARLSESYRRASVTGTRPQTDRMLEEGDGLPAELSADAVRPGSIERWQSFDRALKHLSAVSVSGDSGGYADAYEQLSLAAGGLAAELEQAGPPVGLDACWFCGRSVPDVPRLLTGEHAAICADCVQAANDLLHEL